MKKIAMTAIVASLAFTLPVLADDAHHPEKASAGAPAPAPQVGKMQENVKKMQSQLDRIAKAKTDSERQKTMVEHMQTMQENMQMARNMQAGAMGCPMMEGMMMRGQGMAGADDMMKKRMDMMQMMMQDRMGMPEAVLSKPAN